MDDATIAVFGSAATEPGQAEYAAGHELGRRLAEAGYAVATGGYGGLMEAVSEGAASAGGRVIGVTAPEVFPERVSANRFVTEHRRAASLSERIHELVDLADASIALPGSIGTFTELMVAWNLAFVARFSETKPQPVIAIGPVWADLVAELSQKLDIEGEFVMCVDTVEAAVEAIAASVPAGRPIK